MRDKRFIENFKIMIEMIIDLNNKLYERTLKKRYHNQRQKRDENYISLLPLKAHRRKIATL